MKNKYYKAHIIERFMTEAQIQEFDGEYDWAKMVNKGRIVVENTNKLKPEQLKMLREFTKRK